MFRGNFNIPLVHVDATELFLGKLAGVTDPEQKRKIIGATFIDVFEEEAKKVGGADFLAQGTLYPGRDRERCRCRAGRAPPSSRTTTSAACPSA